jgi:hypothetical protein
MLRPWRESVHKLASAHEAQAEPKETWVPVFGRRPGMSSTCPAGQVIVPASRSTTKSSLVK